MNMVLINVERESVCAGDDVNAPHGYSFSLNEEATLSDLFAHLEMKAYLASVAGKNHSWNAIINKKKVAIFLGNTRMPEPNKYLSKPVSKFAKEGKVKIEFIYNSANT